MNDDIVALLRVCTCVPHGELCRGAADEIERLRKERDDARWRLCKVLGDIRDVWGDEIAIEKGWTFE